MIPKSDFSRLLWKTLVVKVSAPSLILNNEKLLTMDHGRIRLGADPKLAIACGKKDTVKSQIFLMLCF
jgi:hypothetical protein